MHREIFVERRFREMCEVVLLFGPNCNFGTVVVSVPFIASSLPCGAQMLFLVVFDSSYIQSCLPAWRVSKQALIVLATALLDPKTLGGHVHQDFLGRSWTMNHLLRGRTLSIL